MKASVDMLIDIGCVTVDRGRLAVAPRGRVFASLDFNPRLSNFVAVALERFDRAQLAAEIAAIVSAPGSIYFMGGKEAKQAARARIAELGEGFVFVGYVLTCQSPFPLILCCVLTAKTNQSDLALSHLTYIGWVKAGPVGPKGMSKRRAFAQANGLNNKVCHIIC